MDGAYGHSAKGGADRRAFAGNEEASQPAFPQRGRSDSADNAELSRELLRRGQRGNALRAGGHEGAEREG